VKEFFIDTSFILSLANKDDKYHSEGLSIYRKFIGEDKIRFLISDYVIDEFLTLIAKTIHISKSIEWGEYLFKEKWFNLVYTSNTIFLEAWNIYQKEKGERQPLSFTDATILSHCKSRKIDVILSFDNRLKNYI
jgi:uncharacterized protein